MSAHETHCKLDRCQYGDKDCSVANRPANVVMYLFLNRGLGMSVGKASAQVAHAAVEAYNLSDLPEDDEEKEFLIPRWYRGGHYTKLVLLAENNDHIKTIQKYLEDRGFKTKLIIDEGRTEIAPHQPTALGVELVDKLDPHVKETFSSFELYKETVRVSMEIDK